MTWPTYPSNITLRADATLLQSTSEWTTAETYVVQFLFFSPAPLPQPVIKKGSIFPPPLAIG